MGWVQTLVISSALLVIGCRSTGGKVGGALTGVGMVAMFPVGLACADYGGQHNDTCDSGGGAIAAYATGAAIFGGLALLLYSELTYDPDEERREQQAALSPPPPPPPSEPAAPPVPPLHEAVAARDPMARQLTIQAHSAAFRGNCASVPMAGRRVKKLDADYHARVFMADEAIARCLK